MKRGSSLVQYDSPSDEEDSPGRTAPPKKRRLPGLPPYLQPQVPVENPALHQGRLRTTPHVEGQWAAHVYVPVLVERSSSLYRLLSGVYDFAKAEVPSLEPIVIRNSADKPPDNIAGKGHQHHGAEEGQRDTRPGSCELHISLTRPTFLRTHQRENFKRAVRTIAKGSSQFPASWAAFSELTNDERTRTFLALEIGAGHSELRTMSDALAPTLRSLRQKEYYQDPRFHASIAWALLDHSKPLSTPPPAPRSATFSQPSTPDSQCLPSTSSDPDAILGNTTRRAEPFPTIPCFPPTLVADIGKEFGSRLVSRQVGMFTVEELAVRIGKDVSRWRLMDS